MTTAALVATLGLATGGAASGASGDLRGEDPKLPPAHVKVDSWEPPAEVNRTSQGADARGVWQFADSGDGSTKTERSASSGRSATAAADDSVPAPGLGVRDFYKFVEFALTERDTAAVNLGNGNLVVRGADTAVNGPGIGLALDRFYNGLSAREGGFGKAWSLGAGQDVGLEIAATTVVFRAPSGFRATFTQGSGGSWTAPSGLNADLAKLSDGRWTLTYHSNRQRLVFSAGGYLQRHEDRNGNALVYQYDASNRVVSVTDAAGRVTTVEYTSGRISKVTDPAGRSSGYTYTSDGRLYSAPRGSYSYDSSGRLTGISSRTAFEYDAQGRVTKVTRGVGTADVAATSFAYTSGTTTVTDPRGKTTIYTIDSQGRVTSTTDPLGRKQSTSWTSNSAVATLTDSVTPTGNVTTFEYDAANNPTAVQLPTGAATQAVYGTNACGITATGGAHQPTCVTNDAGNRTLFTYDTKGNTLTSRQNGPQSGGGTATWTYTYQGTGGATCGGKPGQTCSAKSPIGGTTTYAYDSDGNLITVTPPAPLGATTNTYDSIGRLVTSTDSKGTTEYKYNARDQLTRELKSPDPVQLHITDYQYDALGNRTSVKTYIPGTGFGFGTVEVKHTYDSLNRLTQTTQSQPWWGLVPGTFSDTQTYAYDKAGNLTSYTDKTGTTNYTYDDANQMRRLAEPGGTCPSAAPVPANAGCVLFTYNTNGAETRRDLPGGARVVTAVDNAGRTTRVTATAGNNTTAADYSYSYNTSATSPTPAGDRTQITRRTDHKGLVAPAGAITTYGYDNLDRLTSATEKTTGGATNASWTYGYDAAGNRTKANSTTYTYNTANQLTAVNGTAGSLAHDGNGNLTTTHAGKNYSYNAFNQLLSLGTSFSNSNVYAGSTMDDLVMGNGGGETVRLINTPHGVAYADHRDGPGTVADWTALTRTADGDPVTQRSTHTGDTLYIASDNLGSPIATFRPNGTLERTLTYDPYGTTRGTGQNLELVGYAASHPSAHFNLLKMGARYYDTDLGRFTTMDPTGQEKNPYLYAAGDPCNNTDPTGTSCAVAAAEKILGGAGVVVALGAWLVVPGLLSGAGVALAVGFAVTSGLTALEECS
ncbi:RHS repeat-associated core domain-containing protein [Cellulosimicrobium terreum]|nr:RHS repeat-associated core domain-containing protein [Cellulosimicrobium terreum]